MNYELASELREADFPQGGKGNWTLRADYLVARRADRVYVPTLSELIEACGKEFRSLILEDDQSWTVFSADDEMFAGPSAEDAVARLWLASNKKA
jgi:hypothetical protein